MNKKELYLKKDRLIKGITKDGFFKISVVKTTDVVKLARDNHRLSLLNTVLLGRTLTGALLLASELKGEERIRLQLEGNGPVGMLVTEANAIGEARGYVLHPHEELDYSASSSIGDGLGIGLLTFSKTLYNEARPITGTVELMSGNISDDIAYYLYQSEQIQSAVTLDVGIDDHGEVTHAGGILIQALPGAPENGVKLLEENLKALLPLSEQFADDQYIDDLLHKVTGLQEVKELGRIPVHFFCRCTKDRFISALSMLRIDELEEMKETTQELVCHYCNKKYMITPSELQHILTQQKVKLN
jgi:molecular chaperone Hsp33